MRIKSIVTTLSYFPKIGKEVKILKTNFIIVSPYSPKWNNIGSIRWEKIAKYLSYSYQTTIVTSSFGSGEAYRHFDIGKAELIEIPLKYYRINPYANNSHKEHQKRKRFIKYINSMKAEIRPILERLFPISSGGMLFHNFKRYCEVVEQRISKKDDLLTVLITTYDPWFSLRIGDLMRKRYKSLLWVADFRDPSFNIHESRISKMPFFKISTHQKLKDADIVTVVTEQMKKEYEETFNRKVFFLPNGFGDESTGEVKQHKKEKHSLHIAYTGSLHPNTREISYFVDSLKCAHSIQKSIAFKFSYAGKDTQKVKGEFKKFGIEEILQNFGFVRHEKALQIQQTADVLLLIGYTGDDPEVGKGIRTGKIYEYLASCKPIIVIAPKNWEMKEEIECDGISRVFEKNETTEIAEYLLKLADMDTLDIDYSKRKRVIDKYSYKNIANNLLKIILEVQRNGIENTFFNRNSATDN